MQTTKVSEADLGRQLDEHRSALVAYCYRMLGSPFEAEDAVQETFLRAFKAYASFEGRSSMKTWLTRIATNVCLDQLRGRDRRILPMDLGPAGAPVLENAKILPEVTWIEPIPDRLVATDPDPAESAIAKESVRLAFVTALQRLPAKQRAALVLCEVMSWKAAEAAELLEMSVASVNSALQRARATMKTTPPDSSAEMDAKKRALLQQYVDAFEKYDVNLLTKIIRDDASQSMPPYDLWLSGRADMFTWWFGPGIGCKGSKLLPAPNANGLPAYGQYKPAANGIGYEPWSLQVIDLADDGVREITFFLATQTLFPLFGLPLRLD